MASILLRIKTLLKRKAVQKKIRRGISVVSCVVVFGTTYSLLLPALTLEARTVCGMEEHQHSQECYEEVLVCGMEESDGHHHTEECYDEAGELICGQEESEGHHHDSSCYETRLTCGLENHIHTAECYKKVEEDSVETDASETEVQPQEEQTGQESTSVTPVNNVAEIAAPSQKSTIKFAEYLSDYTGILCQPEGAGSNEWKPADSALRDRMDLEPEMIALNSEEQVLLHIAYKLPAGTINETNAETEFELPLLLEMTSEEVRENNKYQYQIFSGTDREADPLKEAGTYEIEEKRNGKGEVTERKLVIRWNADTYRRCGGEKLTDGTVTIQPSEVEGFFELLISADELLTLEEDAGDENARVLYWGKEKSKSDDFSTVILFDEETLKEEEPAEELPAQEAENVEVNTEPAETAEAAPEITTETGEQPETQPEATEPEVEVVAEPVFAAGTLTYDGGAYIAEVTFDQSAQFPEGTVFTAKEVKGTVAARYGKKAAAALEGKEINSAAFYALHFEDADGNTVVPAEGSELAVRIQYRNAEIIAEGTQMEGICLARNTAEPFAVQVSGVADGSVDVVSFTAIKSAVYGILNTEEVPLFNKGVRYAYSIEKDKEVSLPEIFDALRIMDEETGTLLKSEDVQQVESSNEALLSVTHKTKFLGLFGKEEWLVKGLQPFTSEEMLTVTLKDGRILKIAVSEIDFVSYVMTADGEKYKVSVSYDAESGIPSDASLAVEEIPEDSEEYAAYMAEVEAALAAGRKVQMAKLFDITILDREGNEVEPLTPVRVNIEFVPEEVPEGTNVELYHFQTDGERPQVMENVEVHTDDANTVNGIEFETDGFSVYGVVYTVDFEYSVNGKMYQFSLPGGGFVSFTDLVEVLGIIGDTNSEENGDENGAVITENGEENGINEGAEEDGIDSDTNTALTLGDVEVSEATRKFVANVASVELSNPKLVDVSKVENETTVGQIKESRGLEVEYSAELTEEQIAEINAQTVEAGDWALISVHPFTSEETLTVTMKDGEVFTIRVTDGQIHTFVISDSGDTYKITVTYDDTTGIPADAELRVRQLTPDDDRYQEDIERSNSALLARYDQGATNPVVFDIKIIANDEEIEPIEGTQVSVEITLAMDAMNEETQGEDGEAAEGVESADEAESEEEGYLLIDGVEYTLEQTEVPTTARVVHLTDDGEAVVVEDMQSMVDVDNNLVLRFDTEAFSDYTIQGVNNNNGLNGLPNTIYVGDEIYMQNCSNMWVTGIGSVVTETKYNNNSDDYKSVRATSPGIFRICHRNDWNNGNTGYNGQYNGKYITILPARSEGDYAGTTPPATIETVSNASIGLTLNLFDYDLDDYLDNRFNNKDYGSTEGGFVGHGINDGNALKFWGSGITGSSYGSHNNYVEHGVTSIVDTSLNSSGYPQVISNAGSSGGGGNKDLSYLFTPSDGTDKKAYPNADGLFKKVGDYYVYDSNQNYAWYNPLTNKFEVYETTYKQKSRGDGGEQASHTTDKAIGFFPFHEWDDQYDLFVNWNKNLNHHFGMSMSVPFSLPKDPKAVVDTNGDPIVFEFSGDDDLWVFIDGKLAMDIGGIHQPTSGTINFQTGTVTVNGQTQLSSNNFNERFPDLYDGKEHTLQVFYIERGGCDSNCKIQFNLTQYGDIHFDKVDKDNPSDKLAGAVFGIYKDEACTIPLMENLKNGTSRAYVAESNAQGRVQFSDIPLGTYYLKELHAPEGYPVDNTVHSVQVYYDQTLAQVKVKVTIDGVGVENGVMIENKKPAPINLGLHKVWQNADGESIVAPEGAQATFEIKRIRNYETYTEQTIEGEERKVSHLTVGWIHNGETHIHAEYDLIAESQVTVSWGYKNGYDGTIGYILNGTEYTKDPVSTNIYSQGFAMPAADGSATFYVIDNSDNGEAITDINVAGSQYYGNAGGGVIHTFQTVTEPDSGFTYTGDHVTDNQVILPVNSNTWSYIFSNLPTFERGTVEGVDHPVVFNYSYYLEEVSSNSPNGTTVVYEDSDGNVISSPTDAETSQSGTLNITNKVPTGYLRIDKAVTYNGISPVPDGKKSDLAGTYTFKVYTDANCSKPYKVIQGEAPNQQEVDLVLTVTIGDDGAAKSSDTVKIPIGDYWIEEQTPSQTGVTPDENRIKVTITADQTVSEPAIASFTNNKEESNNPDELVIELEKTFTGLPNASKIPADYQAVLTYKNNGSTVTIPLTGSSQGNVTCVKSADGMTWHWRIKNIPKDATDFGVYESNYDITGYTRITKINGNEVENPGVPQTISVLKPEITMTNITKDYTTADNMKVFPVADNQILLVRMTNHATVIVSQKSLSLATRQGIEKLLEDNGGKIPGDSGANAQWVMNFVYFSHEIQGDSFSYAGRTIYFVGNEVRIPHKSSSHEVRVDIGYTSTSAENSFTLENIYSEIPTEVDVLKVEKGKETTTHLPNAVFELRKLEDVAPTNPGGSLTYVKDGNQQVIVTSETTGDNGRLTFSNLTYGVYEIREVTPPPGYIQTDDVTFYLRVDGGTITYLQKGSNKPSEWTAAPNSDETATVYFMVAQEANPEGEPPTEAVNATFRVSNTPGAALPAAGGPGTGIFTALGGLLIVLAAAMISRRRFF